MARHALTTGQTKRISHPDDEDNPTVYIIQALSARASAHVKDQTIQTKAVKAEKEGENPTVTVNTLIGTSGLLTLELGLVGVENIISPETGKAVNLLDKRSVSLGAGALWSCADPSIIDAIPELDRAWLTEQIRDFSNAGAEEVKNSTE